jgi:hypothetical protein
MARIPFGSERVQTVQEKPIVTISGGRFHFNSHFYRLAELSNYQHVGYHLDKDKHEICFEFVKDSEADNSEASLYKLESKGSSRSARSAAGALISRTSWIRAVANDSSADNRKYVAKRDGKLWCIQLVPGFEECVERSNYTSIPGNASGIYQYRGEDGEVIYIGQGQIRERLREPERKDWEFTKIEYSIISDENQRINAERHWLERYKEAHGGRLPYQNRQSGNKT